MVGIICKTTPLMQNDAYTAEEADFQRPEHGTWPDLVCFVHVP